MLASANTNDDKLPTDDLDTLMTVLAPQPIALRRDSQ